MKKILLILVFIFSLFGVFATITPNTDIVASYSFDNTLIDDSSFNNNMGSCTPVYSDGLIGVSSLNITSSNECEDISFSDDITTSTGQAISFWFNPDYNTDTTGLYLRL